MNLCVNYVMCDGELVDGIYVGVYRIKGGVCDDDMGEFLQKELVGSSSSLEVGECSSDRRTTVLGLCESRKEFLNFRELNR